MKVLEKEKEFSLSNSAIAEPSSWKKTVEGVRQNARDTFKEKGYPTTRWENWKYSSIIPLLKQEFRTLGSTESSKNPNFPFDITDGIALSHSPEKSIKSWKSDELAITAFSELSETQSKVFKSLFCAEMDFSIHPFLAENTFKAEDGLFIEVPKNKKVAKTVFIQSNIEAGSNAALSNFRYMIHAGDGSEATFVFMANKNGEFPSLQNSALELFCGANATINIIYIQNDDESSNQINFTQVSQDKDSVVNVFTLTTGGKYIRNDLRFIHKGTNCTSNMNGVYLTTNDMQVDNYTFVDHAQPHCQSNELYKGVLMGNSKGVFNGIIMVRPDSQKTNAFQSNKNILLSPTATINTKPQLEIFADDVKCSHGATTGKLDPEAMFYLKARGVSEKRAKKLLTTAFCEEITSMLPVEAVATYFQSIIDQKLNEN